MESKDCVLTPEAAQAAIFTVQTHYHLLVWRDLFLNSYFSIHGFLAAGPSAALGITVLFLLSGSVLKRGTLFPGLLVVMEGSV